MKSFVKHESFTTLSALYKLECPGVLLYKKNTNLPYRHSYEEKPIPENTVPTTENTQPLLPEPDQLLKKSCKLKWFAKHNDSYL